MFMHPANERWCYIVTSSLIGWAHTQNDPCVCNTMLYWTMPYQDPSGFPLWKLCCHWLKRLPSASHPFICKLGNHWPECWASCPFIWKLCSHWLKQVPYSFIWKLYCHWLKGWHQHHTFILKLSCHWLNRLTSAWCTLILKLCCHWLKGYWQHWSFNLKAVQPLANIRHFNKTGHRLSIFINFSKTGHRLPIFRTIPQYHMLPPI